MGYCYTAKTHLLCCDGCATSGNVRKCKCPYGWCGAPALCPDCKIKYKDSLSAAAHKACKIASGIFKAREAKKDAMMASGVPIRCAALRQKSGLVRVCFRTDKFSNATDVYYEMAGETYDAIPLSDLATVADYQKFGNVVSVAVDSLHAVLPPPADITFEKTPMQKARLALALA